MIALHRQSIRSTIRTVTLLAAITSLLLTMITPFVGTAYASHDGPLSHSPYQIDGTTSRHRRRHHTARPVSDGQRHRRGVARLGADDGPINGSTTKLGVIQTDVVPTMDLNINHPGKSDLCKVWIDDQVVKVSAPGDPEDFDYFLYVAWEREAVNGSTIVFYEFHQAPLECTAASLTCNPFSPVRR